MTPMKDAIAAAFGWSWDSMTKSEKGQILNAAHQLCEIQFAPGDVAALHAWCSKQGWGTFGPLALAGNVNKWRPPKVEPANPKIVNGVFDFSEVRKLPFSSDPRWND